jgi:hypothetical protein
VPGVRSRIQREAQIVIDKIYALLQQYRVGCGVFLIAVLAALFTAVGYYLYPIAH